MGFLITKHLHSSSPNPGRERVKSALVLTAARALYLLVRDQLHWPRLTDTRKSLQYPCMTR